MQRARSTRQLSRSSIIRCTHPSWLAPHSRAHQQGPVRTTWPGAPVCALSLSCVKVCARPRLSAISARPPLRHAALADQLQANPDAAQKAIARNGAARRRRLRRVTCGYGHGSVRRLPLPARLRGPDPSANPPPPPHPSLILLLLHHLPPSWGT